MRAFDFFMEVRLSRSSGSSWVLRLLGIWARDGRPHRLEHALHGFFPAQAALPLQRAPGMEVDRELDRGTQALPPVITDLPAFGEQVANRLKVGYDRTLEQSSELGHSFGVAQDVRPHRLGAGVEAVELRKRRPKPLLRVADPRPRGRVRRGVALGPTPRTCLEEVGYVGEVVVDGQPVHPSALGYLAYGGAGRPPRAV